MWPWYGMDSAPKCSSPIELKVIMNGKHEHIFPNVTWKAPIDCSDGGNEYYCYDDCDWWSDGDDEFDADWVVGAGWEVVAWRPQSPS